MKIVIVGLVTAFIIFLAAACNVKYKEENSFNEASAESAVLFSPNEPDMSDSSSWAVVPSTSAESTEPAASDIPAEPAIHIEITTSAATSTPDISAVPAENMQPGYINISPQDAKEQLENDEDIILLDVRTKSEYSEVHIPGSVLIPLDELKEAAEGILTDKETKIFVYCRSGRRSITASKILLELGYANVYNLGGIIDWPYEREGTKYP